MAGLLLILALLAPADRYATALEAYREGRWVEAAAVLEQAIADGKNDVGYYDLLGWVRLREAQLGKAEAAFRRALQQAPGDIDALKGLGLTQRRQGDLLAARTTWRLAVGRVADDTELNGWLDALEAMVLEESRPRPPLQSGATQVIARASAAYLEFRTADGWQPLFIKGVNLGTALPGSFPAEFPDDERLYARWFSQMHELGANVVRLYTLHPPSLYRALAAHNREHPNNRLWLIQGVWTELPPEHDYLDGEFDKGFRDEIRRVIDAIHGNLRLPVRPGHAGGVYDMDLSQDVLAWLLGREWEPFSVDAFNRKYPQRGGFKGRFITTRPGSTPIEAWLASTLETAAEHENDHYRMQRPLGYTSWPTLDPLVHPTEATVAEEMAIRKRLGALPDEIIKEYDNDLCQVDATRIASTADHAPGIYASYHAYPYYPDFMIADSGYAEAQDAQGVARYLGYLRDLRRHHGDQPVIIAELGVPSSRGIAHLQPEGQHHGGHDEVSQGEVDLRLMQNIHEAGLAGGILFAWIDEWFKRNWIVMNYESPTVRNPLWLNALDAEQNYGLIAALPGADGPTIVLDGKTDDWEAVPIHQQGGDVESFSLRLTSDEAYLYALVEMQTEISLDNPDRELWLAIDTYASQLGSSYLPHPARLKAEAGFEFLLQFKDRENAKLLVDRPYDLFSQRNRRPYRSVANSRGDFVEIAVFTNRDRYGRDGAFYPAQGYSRSVLRHGVTTQSSPAYNSLSDWFLSKDGKTLELRLPWGLLNVTDPSSHRVVHEQQGNDGIVETLETAGFRFQLTWIEGPFKRKRTLTAVPEQGATLDRFPIYRWPGWEQPTYHLRPKKSFGIVQEGWADLTTEPLSP